MMADLDGYTDAWTPDRYEVPPFLRADAGLPYDTVEEAAALAAMLQSGPTIGAGYSERGRARAIAAFDAETIAAQWNALFSQLC